MSDLKVFGKYACLIFKQYSSIGIPVKTNVFADSIIGRGTAIFDLDPDIAVINDILLGRQQLKEGFGTPYIFGEGE